MTKTIFDNPLYPGLTLYMILLILIGMILEHIRLTTSYRIPLSILVVFLLVLVAHFTKQINSILIPRRNDP